MRIEQTKWEFRSVDELLGIISKYTHYQRNFVVKMNTDKNLGSKFIAMLDEMNDNYVNNKFPNKKKLRKLWVDNDIVYTSDGSIIISGFASLGQKSLNDIIKYVERYVLLDSDSLEVDVRDALYLIETILDNDSDKSKLAIDYISNWLRALKFKVEKAPMPKPMEGV